MIDDFYCGTQAEFARLVGVTRARASQLAADGTLADGGTLRGWVTAYCERLREQAAGRLGIGEGLDLVQERAALAREQREGQAIKNAIARGEYAPISLLEDVLAVAASAVVDRFDHLEGALSRAVPDLPDAAKTTVLSVIASARNEWIKSTERLVFEAVDAMVDEGAPSDDESDEDAA